MKKPDIEPMDYDHLSDTECSESTYSPSSPTVQVGNVGSSIKISINDPSGSGNTLDALKDIHHFLASNNDRKLSVFFSSTPNDVGAHNPSPFLGLPTTPNAVIATPTGEECTGFPSGYFRIRAAGTNLYWNLHWGENHADGNAVIIFDNDDRLNQTLFVDARGALCIRGTNIDVMGSTLVLCQSRPPTLPWPNPWSHPLPTFAYSPTTKTISVKFHIDPVVSNQWPRPESEWKEPHKKFVVSARPPSEVRMYDLDEISRWAPDKRSIVWTQRLEDKWDANHRNGLGVVEENNILATGETDRLRWEIEQV